MRDKGFWQTMSDRLSTRSIVVVGLVVGATALAVIDPNFRSAYGDLAKIGLGGYLAQLVPELVQQKNRE